MMNSFETENKKNIFILGAGFSKHFFDSSLQDGLIKEMLEVYLSFLKRSRSRNNNYMDLPVENDDYQREFIVYGFTLIYYLIDYWKFINLFRKGTKERYATDRIQDLFDELLIEYVDLNLFFSKNSLPISDNENNDKEYHSEEEFFLSWEKNMKLEFIYKKIISVKKEIKMVIGKINELSNDIEIISTKILKTALWNKNKYVETKFKTIIYYISKSINFVINPKPYHSNTIDYPYSNIREKEDIITIFQESIIINLNWDKNVEKLFLENDYLEIFDSNNFDFFINKTYKKTLMIKPHFNSNEEIILPSFFRDFSEFHFQVIKKVFESLSRTVEVKNIIFFGTAFNKADSYIYHQIFNLILSSKVPESICIYSKDKNIKKEIEKYVATQYDNLKIHIIKENEKPSETIKHLLDTVN